MPTKIEEDLNLEHKYLKRHVSTEFCLQIVHLKYLDIKFH